MNSNVCTSLVPSISMAYILETEGTLRDGLPSTIVPGRTT